MAPPSPLLGAPIPAHLLQLCLKRLLQQRVVNFSSTGQIWRQILHKQVTLESIVDVIHIGLEQERTLYYSHVELPLSIIQA